MEGKRLLQKEGRRKKVQTEAPRKEAVMASFIRIIGRDVIA